MPLVTSPPEFGRLQSFAHKANDRPCIDEFIALLALAGDLSIPLRNMDRFYPEAHGKLCPIFVARRLFDGDIVVGGDLQ